MTDKEIRDEVIAYLRENGKKPGETYYEIAVKLGLVTEDEDPKEKERISKIIRTKWSKEKKKSFIAEFPDFKPRRIWEQRDKHGNVHVLKSAEYDQQKENLEKYQKALLKTVSQMVKQGASPLKRKVTRPDSQVGLFVYTSDKHIGAHTRNNLFGNDYNKEVFADRLEAIIDYCEEIKQRYGVLDYLNIVDLGDGTDGVDGETSRKGHSLDQNLETTEQFDVYLQTHKKLFDSLVEGQYAKDYGYTCATNDNHNGFFMYITARALEEYLNAEHPYIKTNVSKKFLFHEEYGIHRFMYTHGKDDRYLKYGFPFQLNEKCNKVITDYIDFHGLNKHVNFDQSIAVVHLIKGDLHQSGEQYGRNFRYKNVMSMMGSSSYIQHNYGHGYKGFEAEIVYKNKPKIITDKHFYFE